MGDYKKIECKDINIYCRNEYLETLKIIKDFFNETIVKSLDICHKLFGVKYAFWKYDN